MSVQIWLYCAFAAALIVAAFCQGSDGGDFMLRLTIKKELVNERENQWKLWCSTSYNTCQKTGRGLTTGHNALKEQQSSVPEDAMVAIETCYAFCMERVSVYSIFSIQYDLSASCAGTLELQPHVALNRLCLKMRWWL